MTGARGWPRRRLHLHLPVGVAALVLGLVGACAPNAPRLRGPASDVVVTRDVAALGIVPSATPDASTRALIAFLSSVQQAHLEQLSAVPEDRAAYYIGYDLIDTRSLWLEASAGAIVGAGSDTRRQVDVDVRVGSRWLDNSDARAQYERNGLGSAEVVTADSATLALEHTLWRVTNAQYARALEASAQVVSEAQQEGVDPGTEPRTFGRATRRRGVQELRPMDLASIEATWRPLLREVSLILEDDPRIREASASLLVTEARHLMVDTDDGQVVSARPSVRLGLNVVALADDGMALERFESVDVHRASQLPSREALVALARRLREDAVALANAPLAEPFSGPALLDGRAAAVFFHEIFGHRLEGHRQRSGSEGQTFAGMLGQPILPRFLSVVDDPTAVTLNGAPLAGTYTFDEEGVRAQATPLVVDGILKDFLRSRMPVFEGEESNGHGRRAPGHQAVARQGNLLVTATRTVPEDKLRDALRRLARRQGKPYGLWFKEISGGYTTTERAGPQAFKVMPVSVVRVYVDGRPDELVRGVDIVGTPLSALETIVAAGDQLRVFNGMCGAESGWVPVSAASPSVLLGQVEIERAELETRPLPSLPPPTATEALARSRATQGARE